jgi:hypothetical protein
VAAVLFFSIYFDYDVNNPKYYQQISSFEESTLSGIDQININFLSEDIILNEINSEVATFNLTGVYNYGRYDSPPKLVVEKVGNELNVKILYEKPYNVFGIGVHDVDIYVNIPKNFTGDLVISTASGDINLNGTDTKSSVIESVSGDIEINNFASDESFIKSVSGDINIQNSKFEICNAKSVSGNIEIINSGSINNVEATSGDILFKNYEITNELNANTVSGNIEIDLTDNSSVNVIFETTSGDLENEFGDIYGGKNNLYAETTSGDLKIN